MKLHEELFAFKYELGDAIAQWGYVERHKLNIALSCVSHADRNALAISYHSIENFRSKLAVCDNLVTHKFKTSKHFEQWVSCRDRIGKAASKRNKIAHGWHKFYPHNTAGRRWAIIPIHHADGDLFHIDGAKPPKEAICLRGLVAIRLEFHALTTQVCNVYELLRGHRAPFPKSLEQAENPPTIQNIANRIHAALGHPQKSSREKRREREDANAAASLINHRG